MDSPFVYPPHFKHPPDSRIYFQEWISNWTAYMPELLNQPNITLEIGALHGGASVFILEKYCHRPGSHHYIIDPNSSPYIAENLQPYRNWTYFLGESENILRNISHNGKNKEFLDLVYIDGNHMSKNVLEDGVLAFHCVKFGGYIVFDDYGWNQQGEPHAQPKTGIDALFHAYHKYLQVVHLGYQAIFKKISYEMTEREKVGNYIKS